MKHVCVCFIARSHPSPCHVMNDCMYCFIIAHDSIANAFEYQGNLPFRIALLFYYITTVS